MATYNPGPQGNRYLKTAIDEEDVARRNLENDPENPDKEQELSESYGRVSRGLKRPEVGGGRGTPPTPSQTKAMIEALRSRK